ncbi:FAD-dependent oxidoreductase [Paralimibaculum aggregatum]|uniref:FAD-dependent oxidoreductase n=1 Tax=Paralimibaculum aggregatum TaxID=3036245 RepID=A0ABQ6LMB8_9RHOB|nr:FAD-dependent oxidoreductase [Limibaculum sp. NKW23]GMG81430.1 FAD-dependent oxidoreductase [Limibaculum sp. NKW23]
MKTHARAVVVGGGAVGTSIAYHLAKAGWTDTVLLERDELTSGSTWHAAGLLPLFNMSYAVSHIHDHSVKLYKALEAETGLNAGFSVVGNLRMAQTKERMDEYMLYASTAETMGIPFEWLSPAEIKERWPLVRTEDLLGAVYHPTDGYINPADVTQALAKGARQRGVEIVRKAQVDAFRREGGEWIVSGRIMGEKGGNLIATEEQFEIRCEVVVTATGNHAQRTAAMVGCYIPAIPVEHQYIVTEPDQALVDWRKAGNPEHPVLRDADAKWYVREERGGWILGPYERNAPARFIHGVPDSFRADLFQLDLERIEEEYASMLHRVPSTENCGLKDDFNGPICYTPDGNPLVGPAPGVENFYFAEGFSFGITAAGGTGHYLAQVITEGEAEIDMWSLDPRRYGRWVNREYAARKNEEAYEHVFILHHPDEERPAVRPLRTAPSYDRMKAQGAQFGQVNGWERPNYFAPAGFDDHGARSFRRGGWWQYAEAEAKAVREGVGLFDATAFTKHMVKGPGATAFLDWLTCNRLPKVGRINLTYGLTDAGTVRTEFTIVRLAEDEYYVVTAGAAQLYDSDYMVKMAEAKRGELGWIEVQDVTTQWGVFAVAGPKSRELLRPLLVDADPASALSNRRFPWLSMRRIDLGAVPVLGIRVAYTGELGWELHHPIEMQNHLFDRLMEAGEGVGLKLCGARAQNWLRQEKSYRAFGSDLGRDATPLESGLDRFVDMTKAFKGKAAMEATGIRAKCVTVLIDGPADADPWGREALLADDGKGGLRKVGRLTSGGWSVAMGRQIGIGYVEPGFAAEGQKLRLRMFRELYDAEVVPESPYDPGNAKIRIDG